MLLSSRTPCFPSLCIAALAVFLSFPFSLVHYSSLFFSTLIGSINNLVPFFNFLHAELCFGEILPLVPLVLLQSFSIASKSRKLVTFFTFGPILYSDTTLTIIANRISTDLVLSSLDQAFRLIS